MSTESPAVLNRLEIRRFTTTVLEAHGADVRQDEAGNLHVKLPRYLWDRSDDNTAEVLLVFDPKDQRPGRDDLLVQPGSRTFNDLLELAKAEVSVSQLYLTADDLQVQLPDALDISELSVSIEEFEPEQTADTSGGTTNGTSNMCSCTPTRQP